MAIAIIIILIILCLVLVLCLVKSKKREKSFKKDTQLEESIIEKIFENETMKVQYEYLIRSHGPEVASRILYNLVETEKKKITANAANTIKTKQAK
jgi:FtsZ-interacting cell division protein ZipA